VLLLFLYQQVKEQLCYVSDDPLKEMQHVKGLTRVGKANAMKDPMGGKLRKGFVLPDFHNIIKGYVKPDEDPVDPQEQVCMQKEEF
jgi:hypothetical protein